MNFINKLGIGVSIISILSIGGSMYYYNQTLSKNSRAVVETKKENKEKDKVDTHNINVDTKVEENILILSLENVAGRELTDVMLEVGFKGVKITDIYIEKFAEGKKIIKVPLTNVAKTPSIKDNDTVVNEFRLLENFVFKVAEDDGYVIATSIKKETKEFYKEKIKNSSVSDEIKEKVIKGLDTAYEYSKVENYFRKIGIIKAVNLSEDTVKFNNDQDELVIESQVNEVITPAENPTEQGGQTDGVQAQPAAPVVVQPQPAPVVVQPAAPAVVQPAPVQPAPVQPVVPAVEQPVTVVAGGN